MANDTTQHRVLITGGTGLLGRALAAVLQERGQARVAALSRRDLDITDVEQVRAAWEAFCPTVVINCAAETDVDGCEAREAEARRINGEGAGLVAEQCRERGTRLIHISTDYVFDGRAERPYREDDRTGPAEALCAYGRSKLLGEQRVRERLPDALIVRTSWLFGPGGPGFPQSILERARKDGRLRVVKDQNGRPTYAPDLARAIERLVAGKSVPGRPAPFPCGILNVANTGSCTWYGYAQYLLQAAGIDVPIEPVNTSEFPRPARRPEWSVLDTTRFEQLAGGPLRPWREAVAEFVRGMRNADPRGKNEKRTVATSNHLTSDI